MCACARCRMSCCQTSSCRAAAGLQHSRRRIDCCAPRKRLHACGCKGHHPCTTRWWLPAWVRHMCQCTPAQPGCVTCVSAPQPSLGAVCVPCHARGLSVCICWALGAHHMRARMPCLSCNVTASGSSRGLMSHPQHRLLQPLPPLLLGAASCPVWCPP